MEEELVQCLDLLLSPVIQTPIFDRIDVLKKQLGYALTLSKIIFHSKLSMYHKQLASIILKTFIEANWMNTHDEALQKAREMQLKKDVFEYQTEEDDEVEDGKSALEQSLANSSDPSQRVIIDEREKDELRKLLPQGLQIEQRTIQGNIAVCLSIIAKYDYPQQFPTLLRQLQEMICGNVISAKFGAFLALEMIIHPDLLSNEVLEVEFDNIISFTLGVYLNTSLPTLLRKHSVSILFSIVNWILNRRVETEESLNQAVMLPRLLKVIEQWFGQFLKDLSQLNAVDQAEIALKITILQVVCLFLYSLPKTMKNYPQFLSLACEMIYNYQSIFYEGLILSDKLTTSNLIDFTCAETYNFENYILMILEVLHAWISKQELRGLFTQNPSMPSDIIYTLIYYLQITNHHVESYVLDSNDFIIDDNEDLYGTHSLTIRSSTNRLIIEIFQLSPSQSKTNSSYFQSLLQSLLKRLAETENGRAVADETPHSQWWKMREAVLFLLTSTIPLLCKFAAQVAKSKSKSVFCIPIESFLSLQKDANHSNPFLRYRALVCASRCSSFIGREHYNLILPFFLASTLCLQPSITDEYLKIGALKSLKYYSSTIDGKDYVTQLDLIIPGIVSSLLTSEADTLFLQLDVLIKLLNSLSKTKQNINEVIMKLIPHVPNLVETILQLWKKMSEDAFTNTYIVDLVQVLLQLHHYQVYGLVFEKLCPVIVTILSSPDLLMEKVTAISLLSHIFLYLPDTLLKNSNNNNNNNNNYNENASSTASTNHAEMLNHVSAVTIGHLFQTLFSCDHDSIVHEGIKALQYYLMGTMKLIPSPCEYLSQFPVANTNLMHLFFQFISKILSHPADTTSANHELLLAAAAIDEQNVSAESKYYYYNDITVTALVGLVNILITIALPLLIQNALLTPLTSLLLKRMAASRYWDLQQGLTGTICRLLILDSSSVLLMLNSTPLSQISALPPTWSSSYYRSLDDKITSDTQTTLLTFFLRFWSKHFSSFVSDSQISIMILSLNHLITSVNQSLINNQMVPGEIINKPKRAGLRSAAKTKDVPEVWSEVPFIVKAFSYFIDECIAMEEYGEGEDCDDYNEEEFDDGEGLYDEELDDEFDDFGEEDGWDAEHFDDEDDSGGYKLLSDILNEDVDQAEGEYEVVFKEDPVLSSFSKKTSVFTFFKNLKQNDGATFDNLLNSIPKHNRKVVMQFLKSQ